jgi:hypothetical protein
MKKLMVILILLSLLFIGQSDSLGSNSQGNALTSNGPRYVFGEVTGAAYMLDTQIGRLWLEQFDAAHRLFSLVPIPYHSLDGTLVTVPQTSEQTQTIAMPPAVNAPTKQPPN